MESLFKSNWEKVAIDLGQIQQKKTVTVTFKRREDLPRIVKVIVSCNCMLAQAKETEIEVQFTPARIPKHLEYQGFYIVTKRVNVVYEDASFDELMFIAKITK